MTYRQSEIDRKNLASFASDATRASLKAIHLNKGSIRGLSKFRIDFTYPLSAISGRNGSGKSTVLALAACAYHGLPEGWRLASRTLPYYRFSDFIFQTHDEVPVDGVTIRYGIHYDNWTPDEATPGGRGLGFQTRSKNKGGKWNDYASRVDRPVAYFGIDRVVPPSERPIKSHGRRLLRNSQKQDIHEATKNSVSKVLGMPYADLELRGGGAYKLPIVKVNGNQYSGFNMGAGEQALFGLFSAIHSAPRGALFVIDEIELGLHEAAQKQLIEQLKQIAFSSAHQFVFTTHSPTVLGAVPPEGRFFLDKGSTGTRVITGISPAFAAGRMSDKPNPELVIYVEDERARDLLLSTLRHENRRRVRVVEIGSHSAVVTQLAAKFADKEFSDCDVMGVLDGDQRPAIQTHVAGFSGRVDQRVRDEASRWLTERLEFLPTELPPERYVVSKIRNEHLASFVQRFQMESEDEALEMLDKALVRGAHSEIYWLSEDLAYPSRQVWIDLCSIVASESASEFEALNAMVARLLGAA